MANKKYIIPEEESQMVSEPAAAYGITIPVTVPSMGGYTLEGLTRELTEFAMRLIAVKKKDEYKMSMAELDAKIAKGVEDYKNGRVVRKQKTESAEDFLNRLCTM